MWPFRRKTHDDDEESYESYSSYEEYTDDDEFEENNETKQVDTKQDEETKKSQGDTKQDEEQETKKLANHNDDDAVIAKETVMDKSNVVEAAIAKEPVVDDELSDEKAVPNEPHVLQDDAVVANDFEEKSAESSSDEEDTDDEDLVLVQPHEEDDDSREGDADMSYGSDASELGDVEDSFDNKSYDTGESEQEEESSDDDEEEGPSSIAEKQSLLALAAEHDRVDILKAILAENPNEQAQLLHSPIPPLHVAVSYGSTHATSCLLRMGANPAIRPNVAEIQKKATNSNLARYNDVSAWEIAFGRTAPIETASEEEKEPVDGKDNEEPEETKKTWFGWSSRTSSTKSLDEKPKDLEEETPTTPTLSSPRRSTVKPVDMAPSKREGIRHAFTAEALRCIGADEVDRLQQLLDSGMPSDIDVGGKTLHGWCLEMGALHCEPLIRPPEKKEINEDHGDLSKKDKTPVTTTREEKETDSKPTQVEVTGEETLASLSNRREELESLATALSTLLDNLAEEVSVCHGLLLSGGGAAALASHVRSLKDLRERRQDELVHWTREWENGEDELAYWVREYGAKYNDDFPATSLVNLSRNNSFREPQSAEEEESQRRQLMAQLGASENKVRKLRASITDLSEENTRDLEEVARRSLTGGVKLVRSIREEIREVEFKLSEAKSGEAACRARVNLIRSRLEVARKKSRAAAKTEKSNAGETNNASKEAHHSEIETPSSPGKQQADVAKETETQASHETSREAPTEKSQSEVIQTGDSTALTVHNKHARGFLPIDVWDIILRIIGMGREAVRRSAENIRESTPNVMIV